MPYRFWGLLDSCLAAEEKSMKTVNKKKYTKPISYQIAENKMKEIKSLLIKMPAVVLLISTYILIELSPPAAAWLFLGGLIGFHTIN